MSIRTWVTSASAGGSSLSGWSVIQPAPEWNSPRRRNVPDSLITWAIVIWIIGIPIALGFTLKGQWPKTGDEFWATAIEPWLQGWFWPLALVILFCRMGLRGLWFMAVLIT